MLPHRILLSGAMLCGVFVPALSPGQTPPAECEYFGPRHDRFVPARLAGLDASQSALTAQVAARLGRATVSFTRAGAAPSGTAGGLIDRYLFQALQEAGVAPAGASSDFEFIRRVTLDLTGRIPSPGRVIAFVNDPSADKRARLIDELLGTPEWVDKWTMFFGDLLKNTDRNSQVSRYEQGRNAFYYWIRDSLAAGKPYDRMARELISATATSTWDPGQAAANWIVGGTVTGGPAQDIYDQLAANTAETFLGLANLNCLLCHNGRGHLDQLNLWASQFTRYQAWQFASFFSRTAMRRLQPEGASGNNVYYWTVEDNGRADYVLGTTTGNRPARTFNGQRSVAPAYPFGSGSPQTGQSYRAALAGAITADPQFPRAAVNYIWKAFFGRGLVEPANQFDPARLDPDNPPPAPWTLQPSNARLLNALAQEFASGGFDLKALMREIVNSRAYQLSSRYDGAWNPAWTPLFARKLVRRLWAEELHDAIAESSGVMPAYTVNMSTTLEADNVQITRAMQLPQTARLPGGAAATLLDTFLRGNRDDQERSGEGSILQSLALKNDTFVMTRVRATGQAMLAQKLALPDDRMVDELFLAVLSRYPNADEKRIALDALGTGNRSRAAEDLLWTLYNKVDFIFNY